MRILLIESDPLSARVVSLILADLDAVIDHAQSGADGLDSVCRYTYDVIILGLTLLDMTGFDVIRRLRAGNDEAPILILSDTPQPHEAAAKGLGLGADDFVAAPPDGPELIARVRALLRRSAHFSQATMRVGRLELDQGDTRNFRVCGVQVPLTPMEYQIIELLFRHRGRVLSVEDIMDHLYSGKDDPGQNIINVTICRLRKKIANAGAFGCIRTVWGLGYTINEQAKSDENLGASARPRDTDDAKCSTMVNC